MGGIEYFSGPGWQRLGWTLVHLLWEGAAVAGVTGGLALLLRRGRPRYAAYLAGLALVVICVGVTYWQMGSADLVPQDHPAVPAMSVNAKEEPRPGVEPPVVVAQATPTAEAAIARSTPRPASPWPVWVETALPWLVGVWVIGVVLLSLRLLAGVLGVWRWRRQVESLPGHVAERVTELARRLGLEGFARVYGSRRVREPLALGCWRPMVLLPMALLAGMPMEILEAVIAHELAHIRRYDLWVNLLQRVLETLLFYHPAVWWLSGKVREERELCCDELAVQATGRRIEYAAALEQVASGELAIRGTGLAAAWGTGRGMLLARVRHVLGLPLTRPAWGWPAGVAALVLLVLAGVGTHLARSAESASRPDGQAGDVPTLEEIAKVLTEAEGKIANLQVQGFEMTQEDLPAGAKAWQPSPIRWAGTAWYDQPSGNRGRILFDEQVLKWSGGTAPWAASMVDVGFDGKAGRRVTYKGRAVHGVGVADEWRDYAKFANITKHNPLSDSRTPYATGAAFNLIYATYGEEKKFKNVPGWLREMVRNGTKISITRESVRGIAAVRLTPNSRIPGMEDGLWLDPARGYALLKRVMIAPLDRQGTIFERMEITELAEAAPGIWFPTAASFEESTGKNRQDRVRFTYRAKKVIVNDPKFDPAVFTVPIPAGYQVSDETKAEAQIDKAFMYLGGTEYAGVLSTGEGGAPIQQFLDDWLIEDGKDRDKFVLLTRREADGKTETLSVLSIAELLAKPKKYFWLRNNDIAMVCDRPPANLPAKCQIASLPAPSTQPAGGEVFISGKDQSSVKRTLRPDQSLTLKQILVSTRGMTGDGQVTLTRRKGNEEKTIELDLRDLLEGRCDDIFVIANDRIAVREKATPAPARTEAPVRDGTLCMGRLGHLVRMADGSAEFQFIEEVGAKRLPPMRVVPNLASQAMEDAVAGWEWRAKRDGPLFFRVSGTVTEYRGRNSLLIEKAALRPATQPAAPEIPGLSEARKLVIDAKDSVLRLYSAEAPERTILEIGESVRTGADKGPLEMESLQFRMDAWQVTAAKRQVTFERDGVKFTFEARDDRIVLPAVEGSTAEAATVTLQRPDLKLVYARGVRITSGHRDPDWWLSR